MNFWDDILNYPIIDTRHETLSDSTRALIENNPELINNIKIDSGGIIFSPINIVLFIIIFIIGKIAFKFVKKYTRVFHLNDKQLKIEGREIAISKLIKQGIYFLIFMACLYSLNINNDGVNFTKILSFEFVRFNKFHIAVYHIFYIIIIIFIAKVLVNLLKIFLTKKISKSNSIDKGTEYVIIQLVKYLIYTISIIVIVRSFGISLDLLIGGSAALLVGIGLGLQKIFSDFLSGIILLFEGSSKVGDIVEITSFGKGDEGIVARITQINLRTTKVQTVNGKVLIIPNSLLSEGIVNNWSYGDPLTRSRVSVTVSYGTDIDLAKTLLTQCAVEHPAVIKTKPIRVLLDNFSERGIEMYLLFWAEQNYEIEIHKSDIRFAIEKAFRENNVSIPFPQRDIHIIKK